MTISRVGLFNGVIGAILTEKWRITALADQYGFILWQKEAGTWLKIYYQGSGYSNTFWKLRLLKNTPSFRQQIGQRALEAAKAAGEAAGAATKVSGEAEKRAEEARRAGEKAAESATRAAASAAAKVQELLSKYNLDLAEVQPIMADVSLVVEAFAYDWEYVKSLPEWFTRLARVIAQYTYTEVIYSSRWRLGLQVKCVEVRSQFSLVGR